LVGIADQPQRLCDFHLQLSGQSHEPCEFGRRLSGFHDEISTDKSACVNRSQKLLDNGQTGNYAFTFPGIFRRRSTESASAK